MKIPLIDKEYLLEKFPGKGGWTYAAIPEIGQNKNSPFGWVKVQGSIDGYKIEQYKLMPMGNGKLFLPVKAEIRKTIKKKEGDFVRVILSLDESHLSIPAELIGCFKNEDPLIYKRFLELTEGEQKTYIDWIYNAKREETKANRISEMMTQLQRLK